MYYCMFFGSRFIWSLNCALYCVLLANNRVDSLIMCPPYNKSSACLEHRFRTGHMHITICPIVLLLEESLNICC